MARILGLADGLASRQSPSWGWAAVHVLKLIDQSGSTLFEVTVPKDRLQDAVVMFQQRYPGGRLQIDETLVQLAGGSAGGAAVASPVQGPTADVVPAQVTGLLQMQALMIAEHMELQRRLTEDMVAQYRRVRTSLEEVDLMARGARVVEFQEVLRAIRGSDVDAMESEAERRALRREQIERFFLGGLKATKLIQDA